MDLHLAGICLTVATLGFLGGATAVRVWWIETERVHLDALSHRDLDAQHTRRAAA